MTNIQLRVEGASPEEIERYLEIFQALIKSGGLSGVKSGKTILHFDHTGEFQGIELDYRPWWKRSVVNHN